jgi:TRAP-type C4-dicarboxylate transport system substrate-binding protein
VLLFSKRVWDTLAPADRALIRGAARDSAASLRAKWHESERSVRSTAEAAGVTVVTDVDREAFRSALAPSLPVLLRDEAAAGLVRRIQQQP